MVLLSAAWTNGTPTPARVDAAATTPADLMRSRRERPLLSDVFTKNSLGVVWGKNAISAIFYNYTGSRR